MSERPRIAIVNHTAANIHSVAKALERCGAEAYVTTAASDLEAADGAVLPGVGTFDVAMRALNRLSLIKPIKDFVASERPFLGVCLGMQLMFEESDEGELPGLGILRGRVTRMSTNDGRLKIPHMGWNTVTFTEGPTARHSAFEGLPQGGHFYFVHSFACEPDDAADVAGTTQYGRVICAAVAHGTVTATQFHPEKSQVLGLQIYRNFVRSVGRNASVAAY